MPENHPHVLLLMADQLRFDALRCAGLGWVQTPNLDRLAASGVRFSQAVTPTPICMAARYSLLTGRRMAETRVTDNAMLPAEDGGAGAIPGAKPGAISQEVPGVSAVLPTMMTCLADAGYRTHGIGKFHFHRRPHGFMHQELMEEAIQQLTDDDYLMHLQEAGIPTRFPQGLRDLLYLQPQTCAIPEPHSQNRWVAARSEAFIREHIRFRGAQPFFLWSSWIAPHPPFAPVEPYDTMYDPAEMPLPVYADRPIDSLPAPAWPHRGRLDGAHRDPARMARIKALYYGQVSHLDAAVGQVLDTLDELGIADDTVVVFCSDHGEMLGDHGLSQKNTPYEASLRIPLMLRWPGRTDAGRVSDDPVCLTDILPTLVQELGLRYPVGHAPLPGASLLGAEGGGLAEPRPFAVVDFGYAENRWVCLRSSERKYVYWASGGREEVYDLTTDPHEMHNLALEDEPPAWIAAWRDRALAWEREYGLSKSSTDADGFKAWPEPPPPAEPFTYVNLNDGHWPDHLPPDYPGRVETFAEAFDTAIRKEATLSPDKLSVASYLQQGGSLKGTVWSDAADRIAADPPADPSGHAS